MKLPVTLNGNMVRTGELEGRPVFAASDVCHAVGLHNKEDVLARYSLEAPTFAKIVGPTFNLRVLYQDDVYRVINVSKLRHRDRIRREFSHICATWGEPDTQALAPQTVFEQGPAQTQELVPVPAGGEVVMTSLELVDYINNHRSQQAEAAGASFPSKGFAKLQHKDFLAKVPKVLGAQTSEKFSAELPDSYGRLQPAYRFPKREACLMAMSYSYEIQAKVFDRMTELEAKTPMPALPQAPSTNALQDLLTLYAALLEAGCVDQVRLTQSMLATVERVTGLPTQLIANALTSEPR